MKKQEISPTNNEPMTKEESFHSLLYFLQKHLIATTGRTLSMHQQMQKAKVYWTVFMKHTKIHSSKHLQRKHILDQHNLPAQLFTKETRHHTSSCHST